MVRYRAVFLDRDGTLCHLDPRAERARDRAIGRIVGLRRFRLAPEIQVQAFWRVMEERGRQPVNSVAREDAFWRRWFQVILQDFGATDRTEKHAAELYERFSFVNMMVPYVETRPVLEALSAGGYRLGVISDTFPSLRASLEAMGIDGYFGSMTASSLVGSSKPEPEIYLAAAESLGVEPAESVFVDDVRGEADGARAVGFTAFHLDRDRAEPDFEHWTLGKLLHLLEFLGIHRA